MEPHTNQSAITRKHNKHRAAVAVAAGLAVAALGVGAARADAAGNGKHTMRLVARQTQYKYLDLGAPGYTLGDQLVFGESFSKAGDETGTSGIVCTMTDVAPAPSDLLTVHCVGTLMLRHGQINLDGLMKLHGEADPGPFHVAVSGGTGRYLGIVGDAVANQPNPPVNRYIYKLRFSTRNG